MRGVLARLLVFSTVMASAMPVVAGDVQGSKDHPLLKRYEGSVIVRHTRMDFDEYTVPLGKADGNHKLTQSVVVEGEVTKLAYSTPKGRSTLEVMRNYENDLKSAGYKILFSGAKEDIGNIPQAAGWDSPTYSVNTQRVFSAQASRPQGMTHIVLFAIAAHYDQPDWGVVKGQVILLAHVIVKKNMENKLSKVMAEDMASAISDSGSIALYGVYFDVSKAEIKPESEPMI